MKKIFVWEFAWTTELISFINNYCKQHEIKICGWSVRNKDIIKFDNKDYEFNVYQAPLPTDSKLINFDLDTPQGHSFEEEENIRYLLDREGSYQNNMHCSQFRYEIQSWINTILNSQKPDWILFSDVPHNIFTYLLFLTARARGIKTLMVRLGLAPNLFTISDSIKREYIPKIENSDKVNLSVQTSGFLASLRNNTEVPNYIIKQKSDSKLFRILTRSVRKGSQLFTKKSLYAGITYVKRWNLRKYYEKLSIINIDDSKPYIVIFLHLQPERSSMPEGGVFAQQWLMICMLSNACKTMNWNLYVKEHPSSFMSGPKLYRGRWFYDSLLNMPSISFLSLKVNSKHVLKRSKAVATITGSPGHEAVANGIPALLFGQSALVGCEGTYKIENKHDLSYAIEAIQSDSSFSFEDIERFYSAWENDERCYNSGSFHHQNFNDLWLEGMPQKELFKMMIKMIVDSE